MRLALYLTLLRRNPDFGRLGVTVLRSIAGDLREMIDAIQEDR